MELVSVQPPSQFSNRRIELTQDEADWDWALSSAVTSCWSWQGPSDEDRHCPRTDASFLIYLLRNQKIRLKTFAVLLFYLTETMLRCRFISERCWHVAKKNIRVLYRHSTTKWSQPFENYVSIFCQEMMFCIVTDLEGKKNRRRGFKSNIRFLSLGFYCYRRRLRKHEFIEHQELLN